MLDKNSKRWLYAVLALCLLLRLGLAFYIGDDEIRSDGADFVQIACNIADGKGFSTSVYAGDVKTDETRPSAHGYVVYPYFLAALLYLFNAGLFGICVANAVIDTASCLLVYSLARRFSGGAARGGLLAALAYAIYPPFILSTATAMTETFNTFVMIALAYVLVVALRRGIWFYVPAGLLAGFAILSRPAMMAFPLAFALLLFVSRGWVRAWMPKAAVFVVCSYLAVSPWTIRNYLVFHRFIPVTTHFGMAFWGGTGPADGVCLGGPEYPVDTKERNLYDSPLVPDVSEKTYRKITAFEERVGKMGEVERDLALRQEAVTEIRQHPGRYAFLVVKKFFRLWFNLWHERPPSVPSMGIAALNGVLLVLAALGWRRKGADPGLKSVAMTAWVYHTVLYSVIYATVRYSYPIMPLVLILAASTLTRANCVTGKTEQFRDLPLLK